MYPLYYAYKNDQLESMKTLLTNGANPNIVFKKELIIATAYKDKNYDAMELLLEYGANPDMEIKLTVNGCIRIYSSVRDPLDASIKANDSICVELLLRYGAYHNGKLLLTETKHYYDDGSIDKDKEMIRVLLPYTSKEVLYEYYCHIIERNKIDTLDALLDNGVDPNILVSSHNRSAIIMATINNNMDMISILIKHKANINIRDSNGNTSLHYATRMGYTYLVEYLLANGADPTIIDNLYNRPIHYAHVYRRSEILKMLIIEEDIHNI